MRDYYHHTRNIFQHTLSLMERFRLEAEDKPAGPLSFLARRKPKIERFDGFYSKGGLIYPEHERIFKEDEDRLMRLFQHTQVRHLELSPQIRQLFKSAYPALGKLGLEFTEIASPRTFVRNPALAWGFYGHRFDLYRKTLPHAGFGLGFERLVVYVCGLQNIRDAIPYPRAPGLATF